MIEYLKIYLKAQFQLCLDKLHITNKINRDISFSFDNDQGFFNTVFYTDIFKNKKLAQIYILNAEAKNIYDQLQKSIKAAMREDALSIDIFDPFSFTGKIYISILINKFLSEQTTSISQNSNLEQAIRMVMDFYHLDCFFDPDICNTSKQIVSKIDNFEAFGKYVSNPKQELLTLIQSMELLYNYVADDNYYIELEKNIIFFDKLKIHLKQSIIYQCATNLIDLNLDFMPKASSNTVEKFQHDFICYKILSFLNNILIEVDSKHDIIFVIEKLTDKLAKSSLFNERISKGVNLLKIAYLAKRTIKQKIDDFFNKNINKNYLLNIISKLHIDDFETEYSAFTDYSALHTKYRIYAAYKIEDIYNKLNILEQEIPKDVLEKAKNIFLGIDEEEESNIFGKSNDQNDDMDMNFLNNLLTGDEKN